MFPLPVNSQTLSRIAILGLRNCMTWIQRPAITWISRLDKWFWLRIHKVACIRWSRRSGDPPMKWLTPSMNAPNSWAATTFIFLFFAELITPAIFQASSAKSWTRLPATVSSSFPTTCPKAKLSKYTCHQSRLLALASLQMPTIHWGTALFRTSWATGSNRPNWRRCSLISCIIETDDNHPMGRTQQANAWVLWQSPCPTSKSLITLKDKNFFHGSGTLNR